jgi:hypothetical protein
MPAILLRETGATWPADTDAPLDDVGALLEAFGNNGTWTIEPQRPGFSAGLARAR